MLLNLTNHNSTYWSEKQKEAAQSYGEIMDFPFPQIDESADEIYISNLADEYLHRILKLTECQNVTVHLMGEQTFVYALLKRLRKNGIECIASTTKRIVNTDNTGQKKEVIFQFERFRCYE